MQEHKLVYSVFDGHPIYQVVDLIQKVAFASAVGDIKI